MSTWLEQYVDYTAAQESPEHFHLWCGIALIAATLNRRTWLPCISRDGAKRYTCFPGQTNVVLVGGSGKARKSTAIAYMAESLLKEAGTVTIYDGKVTPERLLVKLGSQPSGNAIMTVIQHEMTTFLSRQSYQEHMIDIMTKLVDCVDDAYETQTKTVQLKNVCCTFFMGTTPRNLGTGVPPQAHDTGFMGRFLWVFGDRSGKSDPLTGDDISPTLATRAIQQRDSLCVGLRNFSRLTGPFTYTPEGREWFNDWYQNYVRTEASDGEGYPQRKPDHLRRLGMIMNVSSGQQNKAVTPQDFTMALQMLETIERDFPLCFAFIGRAAGAENQARIVDVFRGRNGVPVTTQELYNRVLKYFGDPRALKINLEALVTAGVLKTNMVDNQVLWSLSKEPF
jgi:hypothetical protein